MGLTPKEFFHQEADPKIKYLVSPGACASPTSGAFTQYTAKQLIKLYGAKPGECLILDKQVVPLCYRGYPSLIPLYHGNYKERMKEIKRERV